MSKFLPLLTILLLLATVSSGWGDEIISIKPGYLQLSPSGIFAVDAGGVDGTELDMEQDLNYEDSQGFIGEAAFTLGSWRLALSYLPLLFEGENRLSKDISFNGKEFPIGTVVASKTQLDIIEGALAWHLVDMDDGPARLQLGPELAVKYVDAELSMESKAVGPKESISEQIPLPTVGLRARVALGDLFGVVGRLGYLKYQQDSLLDYELQVEFSPLPMVGLFGGYRYIDMKLDTSGISIDASMQGPFIGALARF